MNVAPEADPGERDQPIQQGSLSRLIRFLIQLSQERAWANVEVQIKNGRIAVIHVNRAYRLDSLPVKGEQ